MGSGGEKLDEPRAAGARADGDDKHAKAAAQSAAAGGGSELAALVLSLALWPAIVALPLALTYGECYAALWPERWYADDAASGGGGAAAAMPWRDGGDWPSPLGLSLGLLAVAVGMCATLAYQAARYFGVGPIGRAPRTAVQAAGARPYDFMEGVKTHLSQPEGFVLLGLYLSGTWMLRLMPASYYSFAGGVSWPRVAAQLLVQDAVQFVMHRLEHAVSPAFYKASHKPHHRFVNPRIFDAFNGSAADTTLMILVPLYVTALTVRGTNVWTYMAFGSLYANWLTLIHSEWAHPWDPAFRALGLGTAADHHVHHKLFTKNYGHLFMYWDRACGSYRDPADVAVFNKGV